MSVAGEDESECLGIDEDEPINKVARNQELSPENILSENCVTNKSSIDMKLNKKITHTSELWNSLDTIIKGSNESESIAYNAEEKKAQSKSVTIKMEPRATGNDNAALLGQNNQTPSNLVDTISRLQRSLSKSTLPIVQLQSPMNSTLNINLAKPDPLLTPMNGSQPATSKTNSMRSDFPQTSPQAMVNYMHHNKDSQISMQAAPPQAHFNSNRHIPYPSQKQLTSSATGNASLLLAPKGLYQRESTSLAALQTLPSALQRNSSMLTNYLGSLNPIQASYLNPPPNGTMNITNTTAVQPTKTILECKTSLPFTTSYTSSPRENCIQSANHTISPIFPSQRNPPLHVTATTPNLSLLRNLGSQQSNSSGGQNFLNLNSQNNTILITQRYSNDVPRADWARNNQLILTSKDRRQIKTSVTILDKQSNGSPWQPPLKLPVGNAWGWQVNGFVNMFESAIYINLHGPRNMARSFMLPFRNILATTKKSQVAINAKQEIWPPSDDMLALCEDVSRWELHMCINPNTDIKATIIDPWKKTYLLTIPGKLLA